MVNEVNGAELLVQGLYKKGVRKVFSLNGGHICLIYKACIDYGIEIIDVRHEEAAAYIGYGWARTTREPAVVLATAGPGVTNTTTGVATAFQSATPMIVIGGHAPMPQRGMGALQEINQTGIMKPITKFAETIYEANKIPMWVNRAFQVSTSGKPGPVFMDIPTGVLKSSVDSELLEEVSVNWNVNKPFPNKVDMDKVVNALSQAKKPLIVAGGGAFYSNVTEDLVEFAEQYNIPVLTTALNKGVFPDNHPMHIAAARSKAMSNADVVIILGARLNFILGYGQYPRFAKDATFIQVDVEPEEIGSTRKVDVPIISDAKNFILELTQLLIDRNPSLHYADWVYELQEKHQQNKEKLQKQIDSVREMSPIHPLTLCDTVREYLDEDSTIVVDGGDILSFGRLVFSRDKPGHYVDPGPLGTIGVGISCSIAAKLARPESSVVCVVGDGSLGFTLAELDTAVRHKLPIVFVVSNNGGWNIERKAMEMDFGEKYTKGTVLNHSRYDLIMEAFGGHGEYVTDLSELSGAIKRSIKSNMPSVVNVITASDVTSPDLARGLAQVPEDKPINYTTVK